MPKKDKAPSQSSSSKPQSSSTQQSQQSQQTPSQSPAPSSTVPRRSTIIPTSPDIAHGLGNSKRMRLRLMGVRLSSLRYQENHEPSPFERAKKTGHFGFDPDKHKRREQRKQQTKED